MEEWLPGVRTAKVRDSGGLAQGSVLGDGTLGNPLVLVVTGIHVCVKTDSTVHQNEKVNFSVYGFKK